MLSKSLLPGDSIIYDNIVFVVEETYFSSNKSNHKIPVIWWDVILVFPTMYKVKLAGLNGLISCDKITQI